MLLRKLHAVSPPDVPGIRRARRRVSRVLQLHAPFSSTYSTRLLNWQISLYAVLLNIIILIPLSLCLVSTTSLNSCQSHIDFCAP